MSMTQPAEPTWSVVTQTIATGKDSTGKFGPGWTVSFMVNGNIPGQVFIPSADYNVDNIKAAIQAQADQLAAVSALTHNS